MNNTWIEFEPTHYYLKLDSLYIFYWKDEVSSNILITENPNSLQYFFMREKEHKKENLFPGWHKHLIQLIFNEKLHEHYINDARIRIFNRSFKL